MNDESRDALLALAGLPAMWPRRLRKVLDRHSPEDALHRLQGRVPLHDDLHRSARSATWALLQRQAADADAGRLVEACRPSSITIVTELDDDYPQALRVDPDAPPVLFVLGSLAGLAARRVAIVGTRNATAAGRATAAELGQQLAMAGVTIVSGLARGIDAAAHRGVRAAGDAGAGAAVAVVGNGLDHPYPRQNAELWNWVGEHGALISEWPPGTVPEAWRFPLRNRVIAGLSERVIVVESRERGGSLITVDRAADRGIEVMAVPGSIRSRSASGTNKLISDGAGVVTCVDDVLVALGLDHSLDCGPTCRPDRAPTGEGVEAELLAVCAQRPSTIDMLAADLALPVAEIAVGLAALQSSGHLIDSGGWFEASGSRLGAVAEAARRALGNESLAT